METEYPDSRGTKRQASSTPEEVQLEEALLRTTRPPLAAQPQPFVMMGYQFPAMAKVTLG